MPLWRFIPINETDDIWQSYNIRREYASGYRFEDLVIRAKDEDQARLIASERFYIHPPIFIVEDEDFFRESPFGVAPAKSDHLISV